MLSKRFKNNLLIFVFVFRLNGGLTILFVVSYFVLFYYVGAVVIVLGTFIGECVSYSRILQCVFGKGLLFLENISR